ncbi:MAG: CRISPR-associated endonuclease Cas2 [Acidimicrobiales bacterium]
MDGANDPSDSPRPPSEGGPSRLPAIRGSGLMDVLVTYDVATVDREGQRRLSQVASICERYGTRVQYSVFECRLDAALLERLKGELADAIDPSKDVIDVYRLDRTFDEVRTSLGLARSPRGSGAWIFRASPNLR